MWPITTAYALAAEMAIYSAQLSFYLDGQTIEAQEMAVLPGGSGAILHAGAQGVRLVVIGGAPLAQSVRMWWNYVATDRERIAHAAKRWEDGGF